MSTTKDLSQLIDREMGKGQGPFLLRICQDAGMLPKVKRGAGRSMQQLSPEQLADFVIAVAGTRAVGERNALGVRTAIERFSPLTCDWETERGVRTLREDIAYFLGQYRDNLEIGKGVFFSLLFINDSKLPEAEIQLNPHEAGQPRRVLNYINPETEDEASPVREAVVIGSHLLFELGVMLRENTAQETAA